MKDNEAIFAPEGKKGRAALCPTPPMGWNSWNSFGEAIHEDLIRETADAMVETGLAKAGYNYLVIDDCWSLRQRGADGKLVPDPAKFPSGMKALADYVHAKGLKFGMYSCCGPLTCAVYPGSFEHEFEDAAQFAEWGVDFLKYDNCFKPSTLPGSLLFRRMGLALANCGRDIVYSACQWGTEEVHTWIRSTGAHLFRSTGDIRDSWESVKSIALSQLPFQPYSGNYCHNDMDMLVVGMYNKGENKEVVSGGCTDTEYETHFALWAMMNSPLMIGCDVRHMSEKTREILLNQDLIALNQDPECRSPYELKAQSYTPDAHVLVKPLSTGELAIGFFNFSDSKTPIAFDFWDLGITSASGYGLSIYDCIEHQELGIRTEWMHAEPEAHGCKIFRCRPVKL